MKFRCPALICMYSVMAAPAIGQPIVMMRRGTQLSILSFNLIRLRSYKLIRIKNHIECYLRINCSLNYPRFKDETPVEKIS